MKVFDLTPSFADSPSFSDQLVYRSLIQNRHIALQFTSVSNSEQQFMEPLLATFDAPVERRSADLKTVIPLAAFQLFRSRLIAKFPNLAADLQQIYENHAIYWNYGTQHRDLTASPLIYGILNLTPDSFYDGGRYVEPEKIKQRIQAMVAAGTDVIELGGQTTRPGFKEIPASEELNRIMPYIDYLHAAFTGLPIAVDTYKYEVMQALVKTQNVAIINDVNAFTDDSRKLALLAPTNIGLLTMHSSRTTEYDNLTQEMQNFFERNLLQLQNAGIARERIALDPGIGYAKVADGYQDYAMMRNIDQFNQFNRPTMIAISRKGFGAKLFGLKKEDRLPVTLIAETYMALHGGNILRVHDIAETKQLIKMLQTIQNGYWVRP
ncbi:dihydropteroate synthase [Pediococcus siamensis]|uniref:dihydropteroate synthase n=1 Tax=Pediococcus siamensis TaxID=381829 RepID=UPI0039A2EC81